MNIGFSLIFHNRYSNLNVGFCLIYDIKNLKVGFSLTFDIRHSNLNVGFSLIIDIRLSI